ncbi:uncharacterized protein N7479_006167 [Penicillium vulpinum]|uniref:uncharacterized protein n=1 Tax=Penicillium vulpinum TaxID=29845 RepID=UPI0025496D50|nr:uncharacterized protein N7479_006167 [Penicillium vulpinum]KAJ5959017.1 hypothetical protein N7479_006167 [Penicillium vulpinum]
MDPEPSWNPKDYTPEEYFLDEPAAGIEYSFNESDWPATEENVAEELADGSSTEVGPAPIEEAPGKDLI